MELRVAQPQDLEQICRFYEQVCAAAEGDDCGPKWHYGIYPCEEDFTEHIRQEELYFRCLDGKPAVCLVLTAGEDPMYRDVPWTVREESVAALHLFAVHPACRGRGLAKETLRTVLAEARSRGRNAVHLDVVKGNLPAERLYQRLGFSFVEERTVWYPDTGEIGVRLYEYVL